MTRLGKLKRWTCPTCSAIHHGFTAEKCLRCGFNESAPTEQTPEPDTYTPGRNVVDDDLFAGTGVIESHNERRQKAAAAMLSTTGTPTKQGELF